MGQFQVTKALQPNQANYPNKYHQASMVARAILIISLFVCVSNALFFGTPTSECSRDSQCKSFGRTECLKTELLFFCTAERAYTVSGKCVERGNWFCDVDNALNGDRRPRNCRYRECANCLTSEACGAGYVSYFSPSREGSDYRI